MNRFGINQYRLVLKLVDEKQTHHFKKLKNHEPPFKSKLIIRSTTTSKTGKKSLIFKKMPSVKSCCLNVDKKKC